MSNVDLMWSEERVKAALEEGWLLAYTIDVGKTPAQAYYMTYPHGPRHPDPARAMRYVVEQAQRGSKLHLAAVRAIQVSRMASRAKK